ncbi:MAG TPA: N-methyl-L-tryptophan oxidase [Candidatus Limnocylindrales bacterium]|nr:N-methyl-L-tryptophan oxidase [Candidatus Limnocylindrales bacterium]
MEYDVIVAGVGGMGSATLAELAARGARVLGLERASIPNDGGSSHGVNRIIRLAYMEDPAYVPLLRRAYERWRALEQQAGELILVITGGVDVGLPDSQTVRGALESCHRHDLEHEVLEADELMGRFPGFRVPSAFQAVFQPEGGFVLSERAIAAHARLALAGGADLRGHEAVLGWWPEGDGVTVRTERDLYRARRLVISAGAWAARLLPTLAGLAVPERQILMWSRTLRPEHFAVGAFPVFILDVPEGRFYGFPEYGIPGFKVGLYHHRGQVVDPDAWDRAHLEPEDEAALRAGTSRYFPDADGPALTLKACLFTNTPDEHFIIDRLPGTPQVVVVSPCSGHGFKFASVVGEIAADLALDGGTRHDIDMFRIDRFTGGLA